SLLTGLSMSSEMLTYQLPAAHRSGVGQLAEMSKRAMSNMRDAVWLMNAEKDNWGNLQDRMNEFCLETLTPRDVRFTIHFSGVESADEMPAVTRKNLWLIFKEAVTNCAKHARATEVRVDLRLTDDQLSLEIADNGQGEVVAAGTGAGLTNMRARAQVLGGELTTYFREGFHVRYVGPFA
ncbi:MAG: ATP-binding protein, partial [Bacteroidota bacterium]